MFRGTLMVFSCLLGGVMARGQGKVMALGVGFFQRLYKQDS
jgi:hypothetical protein